MHVHEFILLCSKYTHPNIVQFMGACFIPEQMMIITEFIPRGDLEDMLADESIKLSFPTRMKMARGAAKGMNWYVPVFVLFSLFTPTSPGSTFLSTLLFIGT